MLSGASKGKGGSREDVCRVVGLSEGEDPFMQGSGLRAVQAELSCGG